MRDELFSSRIKKVVDDSYDVQIGKDLTDTLIHDIENGLAQGKKRFAIITDSTVKPLYADWIAQKLEKAGYANDIFAFPAGEKSKVRATKEALEDAMLAKGYRRDCCVIAVGGGVVTDLAGFLAGTYGRGVPFINYSTTLLSAADASIGGKTAVDTDLATNLIGLIYQPLKVYVDIATWKTLPMIHGLTGWQRQSSMPVWQISNYFPISRNTGRKYWPVTRRHVFIFPSITAP